MQKDIESLRRFDTESVFLTFFIDKIRIAFRSPLDLYFHPLSINASQLGVAFLYSLKTSENL